MERLLVLLLSIFIFGAASAQQIPIAGADSLKRTYEAKVKQLLDRTGALAPHYTIDLYGVSMFASATMKAQGKPEYRVNWADLHLYRQVVSFASREEAIAIMKEKGANPFPPEVVKQYEKMTRAISKEQIEKPLNGLRIALDPGHVAGDLEMGKIEQKYIEFDPQSARDTSAARPTPTLVEGRLTWATAVILKKKLEEAGAIVMLAREGPGLTAYGKTFEQWKKDDYKRTFDSLKKIKGRAIPALTDDRAIFRHVLRDADLRKRCEKINAFKPDYTVIIHYNVDETNVDWKKTTKKNFNMAFVGGSFQGGELNDAERRFDFLRLLLSEDLDRSIAFSGIVAQEFKTQLNVPLAKQQDATYLRSSCLPTSSEGVFARNLSQTRLVQGTLVYGESLYQDNEKEINLLQANDYAGGEIATSQRVAQVAEAYYKALLKAAKK